MSVQVTEDQIPFKSKKSSNRDIKLALSLFIVSTMYFDSGLLSILFQYSIEGWNLISSKPEFIKSSINCWFFKAFVYKWTWKFEPNSSLSNDIYFFVGYTELPYNLFILISVMLVSYILLSDENSNYLRYIFLSII